jgi:ABC-type Fe3+ transport system permease subunit
MNTLFTIVGSIIVFVVVFGFAAYTRYLQHKETMALAEKGLLPEKDPQDKSKNILRWGVIFSIVGAILVLIMIPFAWNNYWTLFLLGLLPLALGLGLTLIYVFTQDDPAPKEKETPKAPPKAKKPAASKAKKTPAKSEAKK